MNIAIVDDNMTDSARLRSFIRNWFGAGKHSLSSVLTYSSGEDMLRNFVPGTLQIVFMDILMGDLNGIETARKLRSLDSDVLIVFLTTSRDFVFDAFPVHAFDYVIKPCDKKTVDHVLDEAAKFFDAYDPKITLTLSHSEYTVSVKSIASVLSQGHSVEVNLADGKCILATMTFREIQGLLSQHSSFILCNKGVLVNMSQIASLDNGVFIMKDGSRYPVKVNGRAKVLATFSQYLISNMKAQALTHE